MSYIRGFYNGRFNQVWWSGEGIKSKLKKLLDDTPPNTVEIGVEHGAGDSLYNSYRYPTASGNYALCIMLNIDASLYIGQCYNGAYTYWSVSKSAI